LTVGGWDGSIYWSSSVATATNRSTLATSLVQYANAHGFSGLDFEYVKLLWCYGIILTFTSWEYPGKQGIGCNIISPQDSANFLSFIQETRQQAPNLTLSAAVGITPFVDDTGSPSTDVSSFASVLDWIGEFFHVSSFLFAVHLKRLQRL
jgi:chitinase